MCYNHAWFHNTFKRSRSHRFESFIFIVQTHAFVPCSILPFSFLWIGMFILSMCVCVLYICTLTIIVFAVIDIDGSSLDWKRTCHLGITFILFCCKVRHSYEKQNRLEIQRKFSFSFDVDRSSTCKTVLFIRQKCSIAWKQLM